LDDYLITHQRQLWPRQTIAQIYLRRDQKSEARATLREGIPFDTEGRLRIQLGDMCAQHGLKELARSYYREALRVSPQRSLIEERLKALKSAPGEEEETIFESDQPGG
jgi:Flp pilus assembly protein TadD